jgi:hypothetical protein
VRSCAPYELRGAVHARVGAALRDCARALDAQRSRAASSEQARAHFRSLAACMADHLLPHLAEALDLLLPE